MDDKLKDHRQFKMQMDAEVDDSPITSQVDELRMEKLNQRVTIISILIPVLIVAVLVIAYMDIKQRVIRTEDTGVSGVQNLAKDVESRFSTLSLRQAKLEELLKQTSDVTNQSLAKIQVQLKKMEDRVKGAGKGLVGKKELNSKIDPIKMQISNLSKSMDETNASLSEVDRQIQSTLSKMGETLSNREDQISKLRVKLTGLEQEKIDKSALDLAMKLEVLKIKQTHKAQLEELESRINSLEAKIKSRQTAATPPPQPPAKKTPAARPQQPAAPAPSGQQIEEQPIQ
jgi:Tfp pilus assembly protein PilE